METNKATGPDQISATIFKAAGDSIVPSLTYRFNMCLRLKSFPNEWKIANVLPLHKKDEKFSCKNYRPVSILPVVSVVIKNAVICSW